MMKTVSRISVCVALLLFRLSASASVQLPEGVEMYLPSEIAKYDGNWKVVRTAENEAVCECADLFETVLASDKKESCVHFAFEGDMFGIYDISCPGTGQLEIMVDGELVRLKPCYEKDFHYYLANDASGDYLLNRHESGGCHARFDLVKVESGRHQITIRISSEKTSDGSAIYLGRILLRGKPIEVNRIKGVPKLKQQRKWDQKLARYAEYDRQNPPQEGAILFVGSSTIEMWKSVYEDFSDRYVLNRGISGAKTIDLINYREHLITPYKPKLIFLYLGDNDIGYSWTSGEIIEQVKRMFFLVREEKPDAEIVLISIKPSIRRMKDLERIKAANALIREFALSQENTGYADVFSAMLQEDGTLKREHFRDDDLHMTDEGYKIWKAVLSPFIYK